MVPNETLFNEPFCGSFYPRYRRLAERQEERRLAQQPQRMGLGLKGQLVVSAEEPIVSLEAQLMELEKPLLEECASLAPPWCRSVERDMAGIMERVRLLEEADALRKEQLEGVGREVERETLAWKARNEELTLKVSTLLTDVWAKGAANYSQRLGVLEKELALVRERVNQGETVLRRHADKVDLGIAELKLEACDDPQAGLEARVQELERNLSLAESECAGQQVSLVQRPMWLAEILRTMRTEMREMRQWAEIEFSQTRQSPPIVECVANLVLQDDGDELKQRRRSPPRVESIANLALQDDVAGEAAEPQKMLVVSGCEEQRPINGEYRIQAERYLNRPVFFSEEADAYLFRSSHNRSWAVGDASSGMILALVQDDARSPSEIKGQWNVYRIQDKSWRLCPSIALDLAST